MKDDRTKASPTRHPNGHADRPVLPPPLPVEEREDSTEGFFRETPKGIFTPDGFLCSLLKVTARTRTKESEEWGLLLEWEDADGVRHQYAMPLELLAGDGREIREILLRGGLSINHAKRNLIPSYLQSRRPQQHVLVTSHVGWHNRTYVLPGASIPEGAERVLYQTPARFEHRYHVRGTLNDWCQTIGRLCAGNSRLVFSVSMAFAATQLRPLEFEGGGFHFYGLSSVGKTTTQYVAGSICGAGSQGQSFKRSWRNTKTAIEVMAEAHNDGLLLLDEIREMNDPKDVDSVVYMLANGSGMTRADKSIATRRTLAWCLLFHSTGEMRLDEFASSAGSRIKAGAEVRLVNIPADAGADMGIFENLHGAASPREFAEQLRKASNWQCGTPLRTFLENFTRNYDGNVAWLKKQVEDFHNSALTPEQRAKAAPEVGRALTRFALVAAAGELATRFGITGWERGESRRAAVRCFRDWIRERGGLEQSDVEGGIRQVRYLLQTRGAGHFQSVVTRIDPNTRAAIEEKILQRDGYWKDEDGERFYLIFPEVWKNDYCKGFDPLQIAKALADRGALQTGDGRNLQRRETYPGGRDRFYVIKADF
jgi:uncharacterized protein (DUF927 family)